MQWMILFRLVLPTVQKYLAGYMANYLESLRDRRKQQAQLAGSAIECPPCPAVEQPAAGSRKIWYGASGLLLGGALGLIGYLLLRPAKPAA